jgi:hypothetical protein
VVKLTRISDILSTHGVDVQWLQLQDDNSYLDKGNIRVRHEPSKSEEIFIEAGYTSADYEAIFTETAVARRDRLVFDGKTWQILDSLKRVAVGETFYEATVRRLLS